MLYLHVSLSRSRLCHALRPPWTCACQSLGPLACVVASVPPRACLDVSTCEIHLCGVGVLDSHLSPLRAMFMCFPYLLHATHLVFIASFASLHAFLHVHAWVCVLSILQSNGTMDTRSKPTFVLLGHPLLFDNMLVCPFICLACFFPPVWLSLLVCSLHALPISFASFFAFFPFCMLAYMFMHESVCHPYSNPMELRTLDPNLHLSS